MLTPEQQEVWDLYKQGLSPTEISKRTGVPRGAVNKRVSRVKRQIEKWEKLDPAIANSLKNAGYETLNGLHSGWLLEKDEDGSGRSLYFYLGKDEEKKIGFADAVTDALQDIPQLKPIERPRRIKNGNANFLAPADLHIGGDYGDPEYICELEDKIDELVAKLPPAEKAVVVELGDLLDVNDHKGVTPASGNPCDVRRDDLWQSLMAAIRLMQRMIARLAETHASVEVYFCEGNHDPTSYMAVMIALAHHFANVKQINIVNNDDQFKVILWGECAVFPHHGHTMKPKDLKDVFCDQFSREWDTARAERQIWTGHFHSMKVEEVSGATLRQFGTPHPPNKWARGKFGFSRASLSAVTFHKTDGETGSCRVNLRRKTLSELKRRA